MSPLPRAFSVPLATSATRRAFRVSLAGSRAVGATRALTEACKLRAASVPVWPRAVTWTRPKPSTSTKQFIDTGASCDTVGIFASPIGFGHLLTGCGPLESRPEDRACLGSLALASRQIIRLSLSKRNNYFALDNTFCYDSCGYGTERKNTDTGGEGGEAYARDQTATDPAGEGVEPARHGPDLRD